jgi:hypothetical protein
VDLEKFSLCSCLWSLPPSPFIRPQDWILLSPCKSSWDSQLLLEWGSNSWVTAKGSFLMWLLPAMPAFSPNTSGYTSMLHFPQPFPCVCAVSHPSFFFFRPLEKVLFSKTVMPSQVYPMDASLFPFVFIVCSLKANHDFIHHLCIRGAKHSAWWLRPILEHLVNKWMGPMTIICTIYKAERRKWEIRKWGCLSSTQVNRI